MNNYSFKQISDESIADLIPVYRNAFGYNISIQQLLEKLNTFYTPIKYIGFIGYYNDTFPCSYYGVYPVFAFINETKTLISQSGDTMTHGEHIGRGLFISSAELTYQLCEKHQVYGVFGFPSKTSYPGFKKKLNWKFNENINNYTFNIPTIPIAYFFFKNKYLKYIYNYWINFLFLFIKKGEKFEGSIRNNFQDGIARDNLFWDYKMQKIENRLFKIKNTNLVVKINGRIGVGDIDIKNNTNLRLIIFKLKFLAFLTFNPQIIFFVSPNTILDKKLSEITNPQLGLPIGYRNFENKFSLINMKYTYFDFDTF
jgi:hypothetical protein